ncbi:MAG: GNAT family N-acetyltransferase [Deltaproteobacteria bacterium]|jgi:GNAT superfamily N-acetyltransferase|nr:GNAT family N-acetyltransferase [Deltaproteobacteria bacterium]
MATTIRNAGMEEFDLAFDYIEKLWAYNTYDKDTVRKVYKQVIENDDNFIFFLFDDGQPIGFCHGAYFNTFWLSGLTCYVSSIYCSPEVRRKGYGRQLMDHAKKLAKERGCKGLVLDSGNSRTEAHKFYEIYGFKNNCQGYDLKID